MATHLILLLGPPLVFLYAVKTLSVLFTRRDYKGCPKCRRRSGLARAWQGPWVWWLSRFSPGIRALKCAYCGWRGRL